MSMEIHLYIILVCLMWVLTINLVKKILQNNAADVDAYTYYIRLRLISYHHHIIVGEADNIQREKYSIADNSGCWEEFVLANVGKLVQIHYDVRYSGIVFISINSEIKDIVVLE